MTNATSQCITASYKLSLCFVRKLLSTLDFFEQNYIVMYFLQYISSFLTACSLLVGEFTLRTTNVHIRDDIINNVDFALQSKVLVSQSKCQPQTARVSLLLLVKQESVGSYSNSILGTATVPMHIQCHHELVLLSKTL